MTEALRSADLAFTGEASVLTFPPSRPASASTTRLSGTKSAPCLRRESKSYRTTPVQPSRLVQPTEETDTGVAEIQSIMQDTLTLQTPPTTFLGISPPRRQSGAVNPLVQGSEWQLDAYLSSRNNMEALREIDAKGVSFLKISGHLDSESTTINCQGAAVKRPAEESVDSSPICRPTTFRNQGCTRIGVAKPLTSQIGFKIG